MLCIYPANSNTKLVGSITWYPSEDDRKAAPLGHSLQPVYEYRYIGDTGFLQPKGLSNGQTQTLEMQVLFMEHVIWKLAEELAIERRKTR